MSTMKEWNWVSIQSLSKRGYILCWFNGKKRPSASALHFCFFYCAHWTLSFCTKFCRNVSKVMLFRLHLNTWNFRMSGPDARSLKLAHIKIKKSIMCSLKHDEPNFLSDGDERSLPSIINVLKLDPRNLLVRREGKDMFWSHVLSQAWNLGKNSIVSRTWPTHEQES